MSKQQGILMFVDVLLLSLFFFLEYIFFAQSVVKFCVENIHSHIQRRYLVF